MKPYDPKTGDYIIWIEAVRDTADEQSVHIYKFNARYIIAGGKIDLPDDPDIRLEFVRLSDDPTVIPSSMLLRFNGEEIWVNGGLGQTHYVKRYSYWINIQYLYVITPDEALARFESFFENRGGDNIRYAIRAFQRSVEVACDSGHPCLCLLRGLTPDAFGWSKSGIADLEEYRYNLREGISCGVLSPDDSFGWRLLGHVLSIKSLPELIPDSELLERLLNDAIEHSGDSSTRDLAKRLKATLSR